MGVSITTGRTYIAIMPVCQLIIKHLVLNSLEHFLNPSPSCANCLRVVVDAAFLSQAFSNVFLEVFSILHADDELIVGVQIGRDLLGNGRAAAIDPKSLVRGAGDWFGKAGFAAWLW
jgi:hypothetical protein